MPNPKSSVIDELYKDPYQLALFIVTIFVAIGVRIWIRRKFLPNATRQAINKSETNKESTIRRKDASLTNTVDNTSADIELVDIIVYPIKGCKGTSVQQWRIGKYGLEGDRRWMVINAETNRFITQRQNPKMALITPTYNTDFLHLNAPDMPEIRIPLSGKHYKTEPKIEVTIWGDTCQGVDEGDEVAQWLNKFLGNDVCYRLVRRPDDHQRTVEQDFLLTESENLVSYQDGFAFLIASTESLAELNRRLEEQNIRLPMNRFRPNFVVSGVSKPFDEDDFGRFKIGDTIFNALKKCTRCKVTTVDQTTGTFAGNEPLKTLGTFRSGLLTGKKEEVCFGQNLTHENYNTEIKVGQKVQFL